MVDPSRPRPSAQDVAGMYDFRWSDERGGTPRARRTPEVIDKTRIGFARLFAKVPDRVLDSKAVGWMLVRMLPMVLRLCYRPNAARTLRGTDLDANMAVVAVFADGSQTGFLLVARERRCRISVISHDEVPKRAEAAIIMRVPTLMRMFFGADLHPGVLIANGDLKLWGNIFVAARVSPLLGLPNRSRVADNMSQPALLRRATTKNNPVIPLTRRTVEQSGAGSHDK